MAIRLCGESCLLEWASRTRNHRTDVAISQHIVDVDIVINDICTFNFASVNFSGVDEKNTPIGSGPSNFPPTQNVRQRLVLRT